MFAYAKPDQKQEFKKNVREKESKKAFVAPNLTGIPNTMRTQFENMSKLSFDDVRVHYNSDKPAQLQALAYTQGNQVYIAPGQEKQLKHELVHVLQQKQGRVTPTSILNGNAINNEPSLEREADGLYANQMYSQTNAFSSLHFSDTQMHTGYNVSVATLLPISKTIQMVKPQNSSSTEISSSLMVKSVAIGIKPTPAPIHTKDGSRRRTQSPIRGTGATIVTKPTPTPIHTIGGPSSRTQSPLKGAGTAIATKSTPTPIQSIDGPSTSTQSPIKGVGTAIVAKSTPTPIQSIGGPSSRTQSPLKGAGTAIVTKPTPTPIQSIDGPSSRTQSPIKGAGTAIVAKSTSILIKPRIASVKLSLLPPVIEDAAKKTESRPIIPVEAKEAELMVALEGTKSEPEVTTEETKMDPTVLEERETRIGFEIEPTYYDLKFKDCSKKNQEEVYEVLNALTNVTLAVSDHLEFVIDDVKKDEHTAQMEFRSIPLSLRNLTKAKMIELNIAIKAEIDNFNIAIFKDETKPLSKDETKHKWSGKPDLIKARRLLKPLTDTTVRVSVPKFGVQHVTHSLPISAFLHLSIKDQQHIFEDYTGKNSISNFLKYILITKIQSRTGVDGKKITITARGRTETAPNMKTGLDTIVGMLKKEDFDITKNSLLIETPVDADKKKIETASKACLIQNVEVCEIKKGVTVSEYLKKFDVMPTMPSVTIDEKKEKANALSAEEKLKPLLFDTARKDIRVLVEHRRGGLVDAFNDALKGKNMDKFCEYIDVLKKLDSTTPRVKHFEHWFSDLPTEEKKSE